MKNSFPISQISLEKEIREFLLSRFYVDHGVSTLLLASPGEKARLQMQPKQNKPAEIWNHWRDPGFFILLVKQIGANMGCCVLFPQHIPCTCSSASLGNGERSRWVQVSVPTAGLGAQLWSIFGFMFSCTHIWDPHQGSGACTYMFRGAGLRDTASVFLQGGNCLLCARQGQAQHLSQQWGQHKAKMGRILLSCSTWEALEHFVFGWRGLHLIPAGWG